MTEGGSCVLAEDQMVHGFKGHLSDYGEQKAG